MSKKKHKEHWRYSIEDIVSKKYYSEEDAIEAAKIELEGIFNWELYVEFYHYNWIPKQKGYFYEETYSY